jgi:FAD/FMN-containing dehydrogenase
VREIVRFAADKRLLLAVQATGHGAAPLGDLAGTILMRTTAMQGAELDVAARRARVEPGARWGDVIMRAADDGLTGLHGSSGGLSVVGYSLAGGIGWYARKWGLQANRVTAVELVTADGELLRVDQDCESELFWALRGGGGNFGAVTAIEFDLIEKPRLSAGALFFPFERAAEVLHAWREWIGDLPEEMTSIGRLLQVPDVEGAPTALRGRAFALVEAVHTGSLSEAAALLAPLRRLGPEFDTFDLVGPSAIPALHMDPPAPVPFTRGHALLQDLPAAAVDRLLDAVGPGSGSVLASVELRHLGGAAGRPAPGGGALAAIEGSVLAIAAGPYGDPGRKAIVDGYRSDFDTAMAPFSTDRLSANFANEPVHPSAFFDAPTLDRLRRIKEQFDPDGRFRANHDLNHTEHNS